MLSHTQIAQVLSASEEDVARYWPPLQVALSARGFVSKACKVAALAELGATGPFTPRQWPARPQDRESQLLGNEQRLDHISYSPRGWTPIAGRWQYKFHSKTTGVDLEAEPLLILEPGPAALIYVDEGRRRGIFRQAEMGNWTKASSIVSKEPSVQQEFRRLAAELWLAWGTPRD